MAFAVLYRRRYPTSGVQNYFFKSFGLIQGIKDVRGQVWFINKSTNDIGNKYRSLKREHPLRQAAKAFLDSKRGTDGLCPLKTPPL
jgi:RNase adaptor protein for sRNA GlmZ degradation